MLLAVIFFSAALVAASVVFLTFSTMVNQLKQIGVPKRTLSQILLDPRGIVREHNRLFPQSSLMLAFWFSLIFLVVCLSSMVLTLALAIPRSS